MDTTHPSNEEHDADRDAWRARILDFAAAAKFVDFQVYDSLALDDDSYSITWNARIKVLDGMIDERLVETKDFVERSLFLREGGAWYPRPRRNLLVRKYYAMAASTEYPTSWPRRRRDPHPRKASTE